MTRDCMGGVATTTLRWWFALQSPHSWHLIEVNTAFVRCLDKTRAVVISAIQSGLWCIVLCRRKAQSSHRTIKAMHWWQEEKRHGWHPTSTHRRKHNGDGWKDTVSARSHGMWPQERPDYKKSYEEQIKRKRRVLVRYTRQNAKRGGAWYHKLKNVLSNRQATHTVSEVRPQSEWLSLNPTLTETFF